MGHLTGMEWAPVGPQLASPVGPHVVCCLHNISICMFRQWQKCAARAIGSGIAPVDELGTSIYQRRRTSIQCSHFLYRYPQTKTHDRLQNSIVVICSDVEVLVLSVVVLFAANIAIITMSLEFGRRPRKKF